MRNHTVCSAKSSKAILSFLAAYITLGTFAFLNTGCVSSHASKAEVTSPHYQNDQDPAETYGELFKRVQMSPVFPDSKNFVDLVPRYPTDKILADFRSQNPTTKKDLSSFVALHFAPARVPAEQPVESDTKTEKLPIDQHIRKLWKNLSRSADPAQAQGSSLIPLPYSYVVPGGRFREIYYWDSYFTELGLLADHEDELFKGMVQNFAALIRTGGRVPNGNRTYYRSRSQPPFFSYMVSLWQNRFGTKSAIQFLPALIAEHNFWMSGSRVMRTSEGLNINHYWDEKNTPRSEAYKEDVESAKKAAAAFGRDPYDIYRDLRAGAESGWDYSTRWFNDPEQFASIETTSFLPVDLNSLLYHLESTIALVAEASGDHVTAASYREQSDKRKKLIQTLFWNEATGTFRDFNWKAKRLSNAETVAMVVPLFAGVATPEQAKKVAKVLERDFLKSGGLVTTNLVSGQQWDAPNGWAPHQWMAYAGLRRYGFKGLAEKIRSRWLHLNRRVYETTGKMMEKYNVENIGLKSGGGEYPSQDGFGWTNGVYRALQTPEVSMKHLL
jgi:alpha,alpha-trehalase